MLIKRNFWINKIKEAWRQKSIIWLNGVRRAGKTTLVKSLDEDLEYYDCELNRIRKIIESDFQGFLESHDVKKILVLDEIHKLENPAELLKIAADYFPKIKIIATGSSTLAASKKFKDTLTDRKRTIYISPMTMSDLEDFDSRINFNKRFLQGGLPPFYLQEDYQESSYQDWIESYWAKDIQELYRIESKAAFEKFIELIFVQSGGIFEASSFSAPCKVSSPTISNYLKVLEDTFVAHVLRPVSKNKNQEIVSAPKVYGFDTGFISYFNGYSDIRDKDRGYMWEHFVLNELKAQMQNQEINYWRDKQKREVDFVIKKRGKQKLIAIECKWSSSNFEFNNLVAFRKIHTEGVNFLVANDVDKSYKIKGPGDLLLNVVSLKQLIQEVL
jgi:predicted AAA+ superfamily ATPase